VALDPGHGGIDWGGVHLNDEGEVDFRESYANLEIAFRLAALLSDEGFGVVLTRQEDELPNEAGEDLNGDGVLNIYDDLQKRVDIVNAAGADIVLSIHLNGFEDPDAELVSETGGTVTFYCAEREFADKSRLLADLVQKHILGVLAQAGYDSLDRGAVPDDDLVEPWEPVEHFILLGPCLERCLRPSQMPGVIGESLFVTNREEVAMLQRPDILQELAVGYLDAIKEYAAQVMQLGNNH
jgi:N-acetylmuramoyl-L-alanine amidase